MLSRRTTRDGDREAGKNLVIGKFAKLEELGEGSFAKVYKGVHVKYKSFVAIKVIRPRPIHGDEKSKVMLKVEIEILKTLEHPHIVGLIDSDQSKPNIHLVMELCALGDLGLLIRKRTTLSKHPLTKDMIAKYPFTSIGAFSEVVVRHFLKQLVSALKFLRSKDLVHRDLKPGNLLLCPSPIFYDAGVIPDIPYKKRNDSFTPLVGVESFPMIKVADFGFARILPSTSLAETLCGSPLYMAPEILKCEKYDSKADVWSVGAIIYELLFGSVPFRASDHNSLLRAIESTNHIKFPHGIASSDLKLLIRNLLKRNSVDRMSFEDLFNSPAVTDDIPGLVDGDREVHRERRYSTRGVELEVATSNDTPVLGTSPRKVSGDIARLATSPVTRQSGNREKTDLQRVAVTRRISNGNSAPDSPKEETRGNAERRGSEERPVSSSNKCTKKKETAELEIERAERAAQDIAFERDYVVVEKRAVEVNAFADEMAASPRLQQQQQPTRQTGAIVRRATTTATPQSPTTRDAVVLAAPCAQNRPRTGSLHQRNNSYDRRYGPSPTSATSAISKALNKASGRLFGVNFSPPLALTMSGRSASLGYNTFPTYPAVQDNMLIAGDTSKAQPSNEDTKVVHNIEHIASRSHVVYGFAEVKYKQLAPLTPSAPSDTAIKPIANPEAGQSSECSNDNGLTADAMFTLSEEALVLYVKTLSLLAKAMDMAGAWWARKNHGEAMGNFPSVALGQRMNNVVQWIRDRFNEVLQKAEYSRLKLLEAQRQLPEDHMFHASQIELLSVGALAHSPDQVVISSGITAEKLMYDRALEMSRAAAISELTADDLPGCRRSYSTAMHMLEAILENDNAPQFKNGEYSHSSSEEKNQEPGELQTKDREIVIKLVASIRTRLLALDKKMAMAKRTSAPPIVSPVRPAPRPPAPIATRQSSR